MREKFSTFSQEVEGFMRELQDQICVALETEDGEGRFEQTLWERPGGGNGRTRVIGDGAVIEKGGVNFSAVYGELPERIVNALGLSDNRFFATGVSLVLHPRSPMVPITHANFRYFEMLDGTSWFGGGIDLTPIYVDPEEASAFHRKLKEVCDRHDTTYYGDFKQWADEYFYIPHRDETRGVGGVFFDRLSMSPRHSMLDRFAFVKDMGRAFAPLYTGIMHAKKNLNYQERQKRWQYVRRGRYAEFNLVYDKGTKFGFQTGGRTESILMSLPPMAAWEYDHKPMPGSEEAFTLEYLKKDLDWVNMHKKEMSHA